MKNLINQPYSFDATSYYYSSSNAYYETTFAPIYT